MEHQAYLDSAAATRAERMDWWRKARFGMFVHWGLYSQIGRHEWVMNRERIPVSEYEKLAATWKPGERPAREWARLAKEAGMQYMVLTTKHHEGFCLWGTAQTDYNAVKHGPGRDLVAEYVEACHEFGLRVGFYYSLMDWHHPDGARCAHDEAARRRFLDFTQGCVRELCTKFGALDILWYDVSWPLRSPEAWESYEMNAMVRELQPGIIINNRCQLDEDFGTPEEHITAEDEGRAWEACMTFNGSWGYMPSAIDWHSGRRVVQMLQEVTAGQGNLLLNIGPKPDGTVPAEAYPRLEAVGRWVRANGEALFGHVDRVRGRMEWLPTGSWTLKGQVGYYWCQRWPGHELVIGGVQTPVKRVSYLATGQDVAHQQSGDRLVLSGLPAANPDAEVAITVFKFEFDGEPLQRLGAGCVLLD